MNPIGLLVILSFLLFAFWNAATNPRRALLTTVFLIPWGGLYIDVGLWINAYQISLLALIVMTFLRSLYSEWRPQPFYGMQWAGIFLTFAILTSLLQIAFIPEIKINASDGVLRGPTGRAIIQMVMFSFTVSPAILIPFLMDTPNRAESILRIYILSAIVLAVVGWWQMIMWYGTGANPIPINSFNKWLGGQTETSMGVFNFGDLPIFRMNSLAGEPRTLGAVFVVAMMMLQAVSATTFNLQRSRIIMIWLFLAISTLATLSTSALLLWIVGSVIQFPLAALFGTRLRVAPGRIVLFLMLIITPFALTIAAVQASGFPIIEVISARTIERIDSSGAVEDFDLAIIDFFKANPGNSIAGVGLGNAHLYAMRYVDPEFQWYALGRVFTAKTQYLRFISEIGLIGISIFLGWVMTLLVRVAKVVRLPGFERFAAIVPIATMVLPVFMINGGTSAESYTLLGVMAGLCTLAPRTARLPAVVSVPA